MEKIDDSPQIIKEILSEILDNFMASSLAQSKIAKNSKVFCANIEFYTNNPSKSHKIPFDLSKFLSENRKNYVFLEKNHSFIQWLLPNHFPSNFNSNCYALSLKEAAFFRGSKEVAEKLLSSYELILDFYGIKLEGHELSRTMNYKWRLQETLATFNHNHLRMRRLLAHLNVVGFREYAIKLVRFLQKESEKNGFLHNIREVVIEVWSKYGEIDEEKIGEIRDLLRNCYPQQQFREFYEREEGICELLGLLKEKSVIFKGN